MNKFLLSSSNFNKWAPLWSFTPFKLLKFLDGPICLQVFLQEIASIGLYDMVPGVLPKNALDSSFVYKILQFSPFMSFSFEPHNASTFSDGTAMRRIPRSCKQNIGKILQPNTASNPDSKLLSSRCLAWISIQVAPTMWTALKSNWLILH